MRLNAPIGPVNTVVIITDQGCSTRLIAPIQPVITPSITGQ